ncbi:sodium-dependent transporter [Flexibacterium corallicola]|uniref:sodium-dependent transporter n=1 Tax=Flexibacterium corallicola TaxID=3037259 RepID=UPI00286F86CB|nr:sodium-dependent transporter [Pseudovibrio sp. M1P-2-3]
MARDHWGSRFGFIMAAAGSAVGLGNIWKFPYLAGSEGGGAFLIIYLGFMATIGFCVMAAEIAIGRRSQLNPIGAFRTIGGKGWSVFGYLATAAAVLILSYYSVVGGWTIAYFVKTLTGALSVSDTGDYGEHFSLLISSPFEPIFYHAIFMGLTIFVVLKGVSGGIEKASKLLMPILFVLLVFMVIRSLTLPGAMAGVEFFLKPDWSVVDADVVASALGQAFFSLSLGMGALITYGSYLGKKDYIPGSAGWVVSLDTLVAVLAGFLVLPAVFAFGMDPKAGPGLTFVVLPAVFDHIWAGELFQAVFFLMLTIAALTSAISLLANPVSYLSDQFNIQQKTAAIVVGIVIFFLGVPASLALGDWSHITVAGMDIFSTMEFIVDKLALPIGGIATSILVGWFAYPKMVDELTNGGTEKFAYLPIWKWVCRVFAPLGILWILIHGLLT